MKQFFFTTVLCLWFLGSVQAQQLKSPNGKLVMEFALQANGTPSYQLNYKNKAVIKTSKLGLELKNDKKSLLIGFCQMKIESLIFNILFKK